MTDAQIYGLLTPVFLLVLCGGLAVWARWRADREDQPIKARHAHPAE